MGEKCKQCRERFNSGIWLTPDFENEKNLLFCSEKCRNAYIKGKLERIKVNYHGYYEKLLRKKGKNTIFSWILNNNTDNGKVQDKHDN